MIPAKIAADLATFQASVAAAAPIKQATPLLKAALVSAGNALIAEINAALQASVGALDGVDPTGFAGSFPQALLGLDMGTTDQAALADLRGTVGRAVFNLGQA